MSPFKPLLLFIACLCVGTAGQAYVPILSPFVQGGNGLSETFYQGLFDNNVKVYRLYKDGNRYGQSVWLYRKSGKVKAKYFAHKDYSEDQSVFDRYSNWKGDADQIIMVCSGAFTSQDYSKPVGLTVDNGRIVNRKVEESMDGLVIVYATGGIVVSDIDEGNLYLQSLNRKVDLRDSRDKFDLLSWAESEDATIFQTQLLVYKNQLRIDREGRKERAARRLLVLGQDKHGDVVHIVFNVEEDVYLYDIAHEVLSYLQTNKVNVIGMLNLDTGMYNIMEVYKEDGYQLSYVEGDEPVRKATNLLSYYYNKE